MRAWSRGTSSPSIDTSMSGPPRGRAALSGTGADDAIGEHIAPAREVRSVGADQQIGEAADDLLYVDVVLQVVLGRGDEGAVPAPRAVRRAVVLHEAEQRDA